MSAITNYLNMVTQTIADLPEEPIRDIIETLKKAHAEDRQVFILGNGGSAATASHVAEDFQKAIKVCTGKRFKVMALTDAAPLIFAWANDNGYDCIFAEQLDSFMEPGDVVIAISGSGNSPNVIKAVEKANEMGAISVGWCGFSGGKLAKIAHKSIVVNSDNMQRVEDVHLILGHLILTCLIDEYNQ
ncbi:MAG: SIS domain-containing protein [Armatimonadota bacterium]|nr:SIS domain-containing protein [bacterium]